MILEFGRRRVLVEVKYLRGPITELDRLLDDAVDAALRYTRNLENTRAAVVAFSETELPERYRDVAKEADGAVSVVVIRLRRAG